MADTRSHRKREQLAQQRQQQAADDQQLLISQLLDWQDRRDSLEARRWR